MLQSAGLLVVVLVAIVAEVMRVSFPLLYEFAENIGYTTAAGVIPLLFATTLLAVPLGAVVGPGLLLLVGGGGLAAARVVMQAQTTPDLAVTMTALAFGFVALSTALRVGVARLGPLTTASAVFLGLALDTAIALALTTWDAAWQTGPFAWTIGLGLPLILIAALAGLALEGGEPAWGANSWVFAMVPGPLLALQTLFLANPAFVASSGGLGLPTAGAVVLVGLGLAAATPALHGPAAWVAAAVLVVVAAALTGPTGLAGWPAPIGVLAGQVAIGALVANAAVRAEQSRQSAGAWRTGLGAGLASLVLVGSILPYQLSYELPLGVPQFVFPVLAALILVLVARSAPERDPVTRVSSLRWIAALGPIPLLAVPAWLAGTWPDAEPAASEENDLRVVTYNIHSAVNWFGRLDPERIAVVLENGEADVALLQEVARGWPLAGGLDTASWLSRRLGADFTYGTGGDHQHGNAVLSTRPLLDEWSATMDRGEGPMQRGYVGATVPLGESTVDLWSVHLQHQDHTTATRRAQARRLLADWDGKERTIIGGDLNSRPGSPDIEPWFDGTGLVSAQESSGGPVWNTSPALNADHRIDWLLGTPDLAFTDVAVPVTLASDHLPVFATVRVP
ncbi:MAG: endonuclease/exonuclease/phosphatase family protein [Actinomycetota bacterium]